ncbi:MAG: hypothetical protein ACRC36_18875 [Lacrimispora sphenoides]
MLVAGLFKFMGAEKRTGFKDPSQTFYVVGLGQGLDSLRVYVNAEDYGRYSSLDPYSDVTAELEYNPVSGKVSLVSIS